MYDLDSKENFKKELDNLLRRLEKFININADEVAISAAEPKNSSASEINDLKVHRYKIKEALKWLETATDEEWRTHKSRLQEAFKAANKTIA